MQVKTLPLDQIDRGSRGREEYNNIDKLATSIKENGLIHNIAVFDKQAAEDWKEHRLKAEEEDPDKRYLLLVGGRRLKAFKEHEISDQIAAKVYDEHLEADDIKTIELEENIQREDLSYSEKLKLEAEIHRHYQKIHGKVEGAGMAKTGHSLRDTAKRIGVSPATLSQDLQLQKAIEEVPELFKSAKNKKQARKIYDKAIKSIEDEEQAQKIRQERAETGEEKIQKRICDKYRVADTLEGMKGIDSNTIGLVELDPPLPIGFEDIYGEDFEYDDSLTKENYIPKMREYLTEAYRIMKSHSWIIVWYPIEPWHQPLHELMLDVGFKTRAIPLVWNKRTGNSRAANYNLGNAYEVALYGRKGDIVLNKPGYDNVFTFKKPSQKKRIHRTEKPIELYMDILQTFCRKGTPICTGFAGSGNLILAAENVDMTAFGFDTSSDMKNKFDLKVHKALPPNYSSYIKKRNFSPGSIE